MLAVTVGLLTACGAEDRQAPTIADFVLEKAPTGSGDKQVGVAGKPLEQDFRALVTRDGMPAEGVTVYWTTMQGSMSLATDPTDADGISASRWTTEPEYVEQESFASLEPVRGPRVPGSVLPGMIMYTALAYPDPDAPNTVLVLNEGGNRFEPASITAAAGGTVNWYWPVGSVGHNIVRMTVTPRQRPGHRRLSQVPQLHVRRPGGLPLSLCSARRPGWSRHVGVG